MILTQEQRNAGKAFFILKKGVFLNKNNGDAPAAGLAGQFIGAQLREYEGPSFTAHNLHLYFLSNLGEFIISLNAESAATKSVLTFIHPSQVKLGDTLELWPVVEDEGDKSVTRLLVKKDGQWLRRPENVESVKQATLQSRIQEFLNAYPLVSSF